MDRTHVHLQHVQKRATRLFFQVVGNLLVFRQCRLEVRRLIGLLESSLEARPGLGEVVWKRFLLRRMGPELLKSLQENGRVLTLRFVIVISQSF